MDNYGIGEFTGLIETSVGTVQTEAISLFHTVRTIGYILIVVFFVWLVYLVIGLIRVKHETEDSFENHFIQRAQKATPDNRRTLHWKEVTQAISSDQIGLWRLAVIESDSMLEEAISERYGLSEETFGEKLKRFRRDQFPWIDAAWEVHRLRNVLAHEGARYALNHREAFRAYKIYEHLLNELGYFG